MDTEKIVDQVAHLARLGPYSIKAQEKLSKEFRRILGLLGVLEELKSSSVTASDSHPANVLREDKAELFLAASKIISNFPDKEGSFLKVPKVIA